VRDTNSTFSVNERLCDRVRVETGGRGYLLAVRKVWVDGCGMINVMPSARSFVLCKGLGSQLSARRTNEKVYGCRKVE
jgi:hypothetical protein